MEDNKRTNPYWNHLRLEEVVSSNGSAEVKCTVFPDLFNFSGKVHGGVLATLVDASIGSSLRLTLDVTQSSATVELNINYLKPAKEGTRSLLAKATLVHRGRKLAVGRSEIIDNRGNLIAMGTAAFMIIDKEDAAKKSNDY